MGCAENNDHVKVIAFDLDGTITQHKEKLGDRNKLVLNKLREKYKLIIVGAGDVSRIFSQLNEYPIDIIGNYGMQYGKYNIKTKQIDILRNISVNCNKEDIEEKIIVLRNKYGYTEYRGDDVEYHPSGCITFPILGTKAHQNDKLSFDPDRKKRRAMFNDVKDLFVDYNVFVGGSSSFDMAPKPYNKYYALDLYCKENCLNHNNVVYVGDDYGLGGNDESLYKSDFKFIRIDNYKNLENNLKDL